MFPDAHQTRLTLSISSRSLLTVTWRVFRTHSPSSSLRPRSLLTCSFPTRSNHAIPRRVDAASVRQEEHDDGSGGERKASEGLLEPSGQDAV
eukprot:3937416-Rhodomonas_salina.4